jgi:uncharacterized integral membrane protein
MIDDDSNLAAVHSDGRGAGHTARLILAGALLVILIALIADNTDDTRVGYVFGHATAPLFVVLLIAAVLGALIGWLLLHRRHRHET